MTRLDLDDIQARAGKAIEPPWTYKADEYGEYVIAPRPTDYDEDMDDEPVFGIVRACAETGEITDTLKWIAHARSDIPALVEECRRLRGELEAWAEYGCDGGWKDGLICRDIWEDDVQLDLDCYCGPCRAQAILLGERSALEPRP